MSVLGPERTWPFALYVRQRKERAVAAEFFVGGATYISIVDRAEAANRNYEPAAA